MNSKSTLETLNTLARYVIRSFYPELFIVVNEMLRHTEFVQADQIAKRLNLTEQLVNKSLNELKQKRFAHRVTYKVHARFLLGRSKTDYVFAFFSFLFFFFFFFLKDLVFWGFDYHAMVNIVRYKVAMIKQKEAEKSGKSGAAAGDYVCLKCGRGMTWAVFVKLASSGSGNPVCQSRGCGGALQKESKRAAEGLKPLEVIARALQRLEGQEIPILGKRTMNATIEEAARKEDEMRPDGDPKYEMPVLGSAKTTYVVQLADAAGDAGGGGGSSGGGGAGSSSVALAPPELKGLVPDRYSVVRKPPPPPWLLPAVEVMETQEAQQPVAVEEKPTVEVVIPVRTLPLEAALSAYPEQLVKQLGATTTTVETVADEELVWDEKTRPVPLVVVGGRKLPMNELTNDHVLEMTVEEYQNYFEVHREECNSRLKTLLM
jgi:hypothetical protein